MADELDRTGPVRVFFFFFSKHELWFEFELAKRVQFHISTFRSSFELDGTEFTIVLLSLSKNRIDQVRIV